MWKNFLLTGFIFCMSVFVFYITLLDLNPLGEQKALAYFSFFISFFLGIGSFFTFFFFFLAEVLLEEEQGSKSFLLALRRGGIVALYFTGLLFLQLFRLLGLFEAILLAAFLSIIEWIFVTSIKSK